MGTVVSGVQHCACLIREDGKRIIFLRGTYHAAALAYIPMVLRRSRFLRFTASFDRKLPLDRSCRILPPVYPFGRCQRTNALDISAVAPGSFGRDRADCFPVDRRAGFQCLAWFGALGYDYEFDVEAIRQELLGIGTGMGLTIDSSLTPDSASWGNPVTASKDFQGTSLERSLKDYVRSMPDLITAYGGSPIQYFTIYAENLGGGSYRFYFLY